LSCLTILLLCVDDCLGEFSKPMRQHIIKFYKRVLEEELVERAILKSQIRDKDDSDNPIMMKSASGTSTHGVEVKSEKLEFTDSVECFYCVNLCYLSYIKCNK